ncbi:MAG: hypothetical protein JSV03_08525, partial [Planctomycetota bacterium]
GTATQPSEEVDDRAVILRISETKDMVSVDAASKSGTPNEVSKSVHVSADQKPAKLALSKRDEKVEISADGIEVSKPDERVEISAGDGAFKLEVEKPGKSVNISIGKSLVPKVSVFEENKRGISKIDKVEQGGTVEAVLIGGAGELRKSIRYIDKPWVDNLAEFINRNPQGQWIVAHSTQPMPSREEAERSAAKSAVDQLIPRVQSRVSSRVQDALRPALIEKDIYGMGMIADRFVQSFKRPYGRVWQEYLLVDASTDKLTFMAARQRSAHTRDSYNTLIKQYLPIVGMILLVLVVYGFLNVATRGYYTWSLRIAGIVCVATVVLLILNYA